MQCTHLHVHVRVHMYWVYFRQQVFVRELKSWHEAIDHCRDMNGHLMEPKTAEAYSIVAEFYQDVGARIWLGGSDETNEGEWVWASDGSAIDMTQLWAPDRPSNWREDADYICTHGGGFLDCGVYDRPFICTIP